MVGRQLLATELLGRTHVDEAGVAADLADDLVAHRAQLGPLLARDREPGRLVPGHVVHQLTALQLPLLASAVHQLDVVEPPQLEEPVGVGGEPVVVASVQHDRGVRPDARLGEQRREPGLVLEVTPHIGVQVGAPVPAHRSTDMSLVVGRCVLVDLDQANAGIVEVLLDPIGGDQYVRLGVFPHGGPPSSRTDPDRAHPRRCRVPPSPRPTSSRESTAAAARTRAAPRRHRPHPSGRNASGPRSWGRWGTPWW